MANLNSKFIIASDLQSLFRDKDTGLPLANGIITFYKDDARTEKKNVYTISGNPLTGGFVYTALPNPLTLNAIGTVSYLNNDVIIYYYPYQGAPDDNDNTVELYYVTVESEGNVPQFVRVAWPNFFNQAETDSQLINLVPNGQFLAHTAVPNTYNSAGVLQTENGQITENVTYIAQGGWSYSRYTDHTGSGAKDFVTFTPFPDYTDTPSGNPPYALTIECSTVGTGYPCKDARLRFRDVNRFASADASFTIAFYVKSESGNILSDLSLYLIKNYGLGGSVEERSQITSTTYEAKTSWALVQFQGINFGITTAGKTIGTDSYIEIGFALPVNATFHVSYTDVALFSGNHVITLYPESTNAAMLSEGVAGWMPTPAADGSNLFLPLVLTKQGLSFDSSQVGKIYASLQTTPAIGELVCDGTTYFTADYSSDGIPYSRLAAKLFDTTTGLSKFGTGTNYAQCYISTASTDLLVLATNKVNSAQTAPLDGSPLTTFTFSGTSVAVHAALGFKAYTNSTGLITVISTFVTPTFGTPAASFADGSTATSMSFTQITTAGSTGARYKVSFQAVDAATLKNPGGVGKFFTFSSNTDPYYIWFKYTDETDPAPGGTGYLVTLIDGMSAADVAIQISNIINGTQVNYITTKAKSAINTGSYFKFYANSQLYAVWYKKAAEDTAPSVPGAILIEVDVTDAGITTAANIALATKKAINAAYFAVPDLRGMFLRGYDPNKVYDIDADKRFSYFASAVANNPGTFEVDQFTTHYHQNTAYDSSTLPDQNGFSGAPTNTNPDVKNSTYTGGSETRPVNVTVNWVIKY